MTTITTISLVDQILAVLRVRRTKSFQFCESSEIALQLDRTKSEIALRLHEMYESGYVTRLNDSRTTKYRVAPDSERTKGCCCCCNGKLFDDSRLFCETCGPEFSGRV